MESQIVIYGLTLEKFMEELTGIVRQEVQIAESTNNAAIPKLQLCKYCEASYHTIQKWFKEDNIDHVTYAGLDEFRSRHRKYSRKTNLL